METKIIQLPYGCLSMWQKWSFCFRFCLPFLPSQFVLFTIEIHVPGFRPAAWTPQWIPGLLPRLVSYPRRPRMFTVLASIQFNWNYFDAHNKLPPSLRREEPGLGMAQLQAQQQTYK